MNRKLKLFLICFLFIVLGSHSFAEVDLTELFENIHPAVATVITYDKNKKPLGQGSGFFIDANGHLITNYHVLAGAFHAEVRAYDGKSYPIKSVIGENKKMDLIKVLVDIPRSSVRWIEATRTLPSVAERVVVIGSPMGLEQTVSEGIVSSVREIPELGKILQISASISSGSSGGPVVNMKEQVIGVVSFYLIKGQNLNFAVPALYLLDLKPSKAIKTISEWTYGVDKKSLRKAPRQGRLFVHTEPKGARIRILNIKPRFFQGIALKPGRYYIKVTSDGYESKNVWIRIWPGEDKNLRISLEGTLSGIMLDRLSEQDMEEYKEAVDAYKECFQNDPDDKLCHMGFGKAFFGIGAIGESFYREAVDAYKECLRIDPDDRICRLGLADSYKRSGNHKEAIDIYKECIRDLPHEPSLHLKMANSYQSLGLDNKAIDECNLILKFDPDDEMAYETYLLLGDSYWGLNNYTEAIKAFKQALLIKPDSAYAHRLLGAAYHRSGDRSSALDQYKILKDLDNEGANMLFDFIYR